LKQRAAQKFGYGQGARVAMVMARLTSEVPGSVILLSKTFTPFRVPS